MPRRAASPRPAKGPKAYDHREQEALLHPDIGLQAQCRKKKDPATCRYDRSLDPQLSWDINADREAAESLIGQIEQAAAKLEKATDPKEIYNLQSAVRNAAAELKRLSSPFLDRAGKAEREAYAKSYKHLHVIGFAVEDATTKLIRSCEAAVGIPATYAAATMDLQKHDLLKTTRASHIFSVTGAPEIRLTRLAKKSREGKALYQVSLLGLDVFDPVTMETAHRHGDDVPAWLLDTDYNELAFFVAQAFFPRTAAWDNLKRELRGVYADSVWEHLAGTLSEPFEGGARGQIAVKVIDDRGNELLVVKKLSEAEAAQ